MKRISKKHFLLIVAAIHVLVLGLFLVWERYFSPTKVSFVHYQVISLGQISKANDNPFIKIKHYSQDELDKLSGSDMVIIDAMGLRITEEQRQQLISLSEKVPVLSITATNPANDIVSVDSLTESVLKSYLYEGGRKNYKNMLLYIRKHIDKKHIFAQEPQSPVKSFQGLIYHPDIKDKDKESLEFSSVSEYNAFLSKNGLLKDNAPRVVVTGAMGNPDDLIRALEAKGDVVYPIRSVHRAIEMHNIDSIMPSIVINMAHGRLGDKFVEYLTKMNIPLICPLNVNRSKEEWEADKMGMSGGFLSQSIATPEIDGALRSYVLFGHRIDKEGLPEVYAMPERLESFVSNIQRYLELKRKSNVDKKIAIYYFKGPGLNKMVAGGMEVAPSLYNLLKRLKSEGYNVAGLPDSSEGLEKLIQAQGAIFGGYAEGSIANFIKTGKPELISSSEYENWSEKALRKEMREQVVAENGDFPGKYMSTDDGYLALSRVKLGNIVLLPQPPAGGGKNSFKMVHGTDALPPYPYIAAYLWARYEFGADAIIHIGTHGSLEFTPRKQVALSSLDWPDILVGDIPHFYIYTISNVGEGVIAKRRSYAGLQSYLTPPFMESGVSDVYKPILNKIKVYNELSKDIEKENRTLSKSDKAALDKASISVKTLTVSMGIHRELGLDSLVRTPYTSDEITRIENFVEEMAEENVTGKLYTMGVPYEPDRIRSSVYAMSTEPIAYSLLALDKIRGRADNSFSEHRSLFAKHYLNPARDIVKRLYDNPALADDAFVCKVAGVSLEELTKAHKIEESRNAPTGMMAMMMASSTGYKSSDASGMDAMMKAMKEMKGKGGMMAMMKAMKAMKGKGGMMSMMSMMKAMKGKGGMKAMMSLHGKKGKEMMEAMMKMQAEKEKTKPQNAMAGGSDVNKNEGYSKEEIKFALSVIEIERAIKNIEKYKKALQQSPELELSSLVNALNGGYTEPSAGGDPIANPNSIPTGRNLYSINAESTPSEAAWEKGVRLAKNTIDTYRMRHNDSIPRKVSYTLWSSEFIETEGATIAQVLYMLGVEPVRDAFGRVSDLRLIPSEELGRPRIDVVVQTSGQLRDIAASRLFLISRAVEMAAAAKDDKYENQVAEGVLETEKTLLDKGFTPKDAREMSTFRVFGGMNGAYGTGIQGMVMSGDKWETEKEIADTYLNNMGAYYGSEKNWEMFRKSAFEAALTRTDVVVQPRQSNTWGALSLDHVYEFMGGLNLAVRNVTGKDPDAYLSDYRNRNNVHMQEVKEAIGIESRTTILNPNYIKEKMKGEGGSANVFAEFVQNTYAWNVMKPKAIDNELWDDIYDVYVKDKYNLGIHEFFKKENPASLEEITAVMLETIRKGMWKASDNQIAELASLHTKLVDEFKPSCSGFVCNNEKLRDFVSSKVDKKVSEKYLTNIDKARTASGQGSDKGVVMEKEELNSSNSHITKRLISNVVIFVVVIAAITGIALFVRKKRKDTLEDKS